MSKQKPWIRIVFPGTSTDFHTQEHLDQIRPSDVTLDIVSARIGPHTIASRYEEAVAIPGTIEQIVLAEQSGVDAVVIDCMGDPGVEQGRELVSIPVIGPSRVAMHVAGILGERFAVITMAEAVNPLVYQQARLYQIERKLACALSIEIPPEKLQNSPSVTLDAICLKSLQAIEVYKADTIIFGCCGMMGLAEKTKLFLQDRGFNVPVLDPLPLAVEFARAMVVSKLSHSKQFYGTSLYKKWC